MKIAVIKASGKQYLISENQEIKIEKIEGKSKDKVKFPEVLMLVDNDKISIGNPLIENCLVSGEIVDQIKDKKIRVAKFRAKSRYRKVQGHRQPITIVKIGKISLKSSSVAKN